MKMAENEITNTELEAEPDLPRAENQQENEIETERDSGIDRNANRRNGNPNTSSAESNRGGAPLAGNGEMGKPGYCYQDAAIFLQEGQNNDRFDTHPSPETIRWYLIAHTWYFYALDMVFALLLLGLGLTEKPANGELLPDDIVLFLPVSVHGALEILSLTIIACLCGVKLKWQGAKFYFTHKRTLLKVVILVVMYVEAVTVLIRRQNHVRVTRALRPLFLIDTHYCYGVRRVFRQILRSLPPILDMLILLLFIMVIFATLGKFVYYLK